MPSPTQDYSPGYKHFVLAMLTVVYAFNFIDRQILVILQEPIKADMGLSDAQLGLLSGFSFAIIYVTAGIPIAYWADRGNRRNIVSLALTVWSGMTAVSGLVQNYAQLLLARIGVGLGEAGGSPPSHSMISDYYSPEQRATALSVYSTGIYIGIMFGFLFGGAIADAFGWRMAFFIVGVPGVIFAILLRLTVKEPQRGRWEQAAEAAHKPSLRETIALLKRLRAFWYIAIGGSMTAFVSYGNGNFLPSFLIRSHGMSLTEVGIALALVSGVAGSLGTFLGGYLGDKLAHRDRRWYLWLPILGALIAYPPYLWVLITDQTMPALFMLALVQLLSTFYLGPSLAMSHALVPPAMRALTSAVLFFVLNMIGLGMGPFFVGLVSDLLSAQFGDDSLRYSMLICAQFGVIGIIAFWLASRCLLEDLGAQEQEALARTRADS
ncbi:MAG: MFS transporter [Pseudomonadota bacterium]